MEKKLLRLIAFSIKLVEEKGHNFDLYYCNWEDDAFFIWKFIVSA